jgi:hypothetical protein
MHTIKLPNFGQLTEVAPDGLYRDPKMRRKIFNSNFPGLASELKYFRQAKRLRHRELL